MAGAASKFLMLLSTPFPLLYRRPYALRLARLSTTTAGAASRRLYPANSRRRHAFSLRSTEQFHSQTTVREDLDLSGSTTSQRALQPSLEWLKLVDHLTAGGYSGRRISAVSGEDDDSISASEDLPVDFARAAEACLSFARDRPELLRLLSKKDIEVIVGNGSPFLFKNGANSARRMRLFLSGDESVVLESERARTVDIIRYLLSYVWKPLAMSDKNNIDSDGHIETSVRNLLNDLVNVSGTARESMFTHSTPSQSSFIHVPSTKRPGQNIEMKRGDWICQKCSFMNFARNIRCLECNEGRPKSQLAGGEWECPQCDFFNYGRNMSCLRCDCKRPGGTPSVTGATATGSGLFSKPSFEHILNGSSGDKPEIDRNLAANKTLDRILGRSSTSPETNNTSASVTGNRSNFSDDKQAAAGQPRDSDYVPFVPFPANTFTRSGDTLQSPNKDAPSSAEISKLSDSLAKISGSQAGINPEKDSSDASESWFNNPGRIDNVTDPANAASNDDFPDIMPMRKGENRFVVNKKKDRSLTSPQHKRRLAMEQANTSDFVPFVPFPPDYFAKKNKNTESVPGATQPAIENPAPPQPVHQRSNENPQETKPDSVFGARTSAMNQTPPHSYSLNNRDENPAPPRQVHQRLNENPQEIKTDSVFGARTSTMNQTPPHSYSLNNRDGWNRGSPQMNNSINDPSASRASQSPENSQTSRESWKFSGKSLEGSAVSKEPDPLDMSEEAKAERWFRRVAQIKDISELSQIPDEDFPEIMPMRKGVNRFVVSKRKTPLERRLTSPQYRRNLPVVSSDPEKDPSSENI